MNYNWLRVRYVSEEESNPQEVAVAHIDNEFKQFLWDIYQNLDCLESMSFTFGNVMRKFKYKRLYFSQDPKLQGFCYLPQNRDIESDEELLTKGVHSKKWGALISEFFNLHDRPQDLETVIRAIKTKRSVDLDALADTVEIFDSVIKGYSSDYTEINSCMTDCDYVDFYDRIGVKLAVIYDNTGLIVARALLWTKVDHDMGSDIPAISFMDRIYTLGDQQDAYTKAFKIWAGKNGYYHKQFQDFMEENKGRIVNPQGENIHNVKLTYTTPDDLDDYDEFPYLDTFTYGQGDKLCNEKDGTYLTFSNTDGSYISGTPCGVCGYHYSDEELSYIDSTDDYVCSECISEHYFTCEYCDEIHHDDRMNHVEDQRICDGCLAAYARKCDHCGERFLTENLMFIAGGDGICDSCLLVNYVKCGICNDYFLKGSECEYCKEKVKEETPCV